MIILVFITWKYNCLFYKRNNIFEHIIHPSSTQSFLSNLIIYHYFQIKNNYIYVLYYPRSEGMIVQLSSLIFYGIKWTGKLFNDIVYVSTILLKISFSNFSIILRLQQRKK